MDLLGAKKDQHVNMKATASITRMPSTIVLWMLVKGILWSQNPPTWTLLMLDENVQNGHVQCQAHM